jgi:hypothetical protein
MPGRTWGGSSGRSSGGSSSRSSSSSSSSHRSSYRSYRSSSDGEPPSPENQTLSLIILGIMAVIAIAVMLSRPRTISGWGEVDAVATARIRATTVADLAMMHAAIDPRIDGWRRNGSRTPRFLNASDAGFAEGTNTKGVVYGYCENERFYLYVLNISSPQGISADSEGYAYTPNTSPARCHPPGWNIAGSVSAQERDWYFVAIDTREATHTARITPTLGTPTPQPF